jgi:hypothetical protein
VTLSSRLEALARFVSLTRIYLDGEIVASASSLVDRAGDRLGLSLDQTVVALAGATGSGKSSIFNGLADADLSPAGLRRPTTGSAYACVWGSSRPAEEIEEGDSRRARLLEDASPLLDWLKVTHRFARSSAELAGLILVDLPDFDSVEASHRVEVDRLLAAVDLIVWVLHPQKYADKVVHSGYLRQFAGLRDVTVVVLNAADLLSPSDLATCLSDLSELLEADGLAGVPVLTTSAAGPPGLKALSSALATAVASKKAARQRLEADLSGVVAALSPYVAPSAPEQARDLGLSLSEALARAAGVPVVASAVEAAYVHRARKATGWPPARWVRRFRPDPLGRLRLSTTSTGPVSATSIGPASAASEAAVGLAVRSAASRASDGLPPPWPAAVLDAARSRLHDLPDALDVAVSQTPLGVPGTRWWWRAFGLLQWIGTMALVVGVLWLAVRYVLFALALPEPPMPSVGRLPLPTVLLFGGLLLGWIFALLARLCVRLAARRAGRRAVVRLRKAVDRVAQDLVLAPIEAVRAAYRDAKAALKASS